MRKPTRALVVLALLCVAGLARSDVSGFFDFLYASFRKGEFANLEKEIDGFARSRERTDNGWSAFSRTHFVLGELIGQDESLLARLDQWSLAFPSSPHPHLVRGRYLLEVATRSRGAGTGSQVPERSRNLFIQRCREATLAFERARAVSPGAAAEAAAGILEASRAYGISDEDRDRLFAEALRIDPNHVAVHEAMSGVTSPMWGGSLDEIWALARSAATKADQEPRLGLLVVSVHKLLAYMGDDYNAYIQQPAVWKEMSSAWLRFLAKQPKADRIWQEFANHAWRAKDRELARRALLETKGRRSSRAWKSQDQYDRAWAWAVGESPPPAAAAPH